MGPVIAPSPPRPLGPQWATTELGHDGVPAPVRLLGPTRTPRLGADLGLLDVRSGSRWSVHVQRVAWKNPFYLSVWKTRPRLYLISRTVSAFRSVWDREWKTRERIRSLSLKGKVPAGEGSIPVWNFFSSSGLGFCSWQMLHSPLHLVPGVTLAEYYR